MYEVKWGPDEESAPDFELHSMDRNSAVVVWYTNMSSYVNVVPSLELTICTGSANLPCYRRDLSSPISLTI